MFISYLFSFLFFQSQEISFGVYDLYDRKPIKDVEAVSYDYKTYSDDQGQIRFLYKKSKKLTLNHLNYLTVTLTIDQIKDSVFLENTHFKTDLLITADRIKLVQAGISEVKRERVLIPKDLIQKLPEINTAIKTLSQVNMTEDINGQNYVNVLGSNDNEVRYFVNGLSLFSHSEQRNYSSLILAQLLKDISLDIGSEDSYLAKINMNVDQFLHPEASVSIGKSEKILSRNFIVRNDNLVSVTGFNYKNKLNENNVKDNFNSYDYNFTSDQLNLNEFIFYNTNTWKIKNQFLYEFRENRYLESISSRDKVFTNGLNIQRKNFGLDLEIFMKKYRYNNESDLSFADYRDTQTIQAKMGFTSIFGDSISGLYTKLELLYISEKLDTELGLEKNDQESEDVQKNFRFSKKFVPEQIDSRELKTVFEIAGTFSEYNSNFFVSSASIKSALIFDMNPIILDIYSDVNFGKVPLYNANKLQFSILNDTIMDYLINNNMTFGVKINYSRVALDMSYSYREYQSYLTKIYGAIYNRFQVFTDNTITSMNFKLDVKLNKYTKANSSLTINSSEKLLQFNNKPEFLQTHNIIVNYKNLDAQLSIKNEQGKQLIYQLNDIFYQREIDDSKDLSLFLAYKSLFLENLKISFSITNILKDKIYTLNGFYNDKQNYLGSLSYEF